MPRATNAAGALHLALVTLATGSSGTQALRGVDTRFTVGVVTAPFRFFAPFFADESGSCVMRPEEQ